MKSKNTLMQHIRGWFPQTPASPTAIPEHNNKNPIKPPMATQSDDSLWLIFRIIIGALLLSFGGLALVNNEFAVEELKSLYSSFYAFGSVSGFLIGAFWLWLVILLIIAVAVAGSAIRKKHGGLFKRNLTIRRIIPYITAAALFYLSYVASSSGAQFSYALPIAFIVTGILAIKGLKRFAITVPAYSILIISMLLLGGMAAGMSTTTYVPENRYVTSTDAPNVSTINLAVKSVFGEVRVYFNDDPSTVCHVAFVKEYGTVITSRSSGYRSATYYETEPASSFNYTINNEQVNIATSSRSTLVNITLNRSYIANLTINDYMGDIVIYIPSGENPIQTTNYTTTYGTVRVINP